MTAEAREKILMVEDQAVIALSKKRDLEKYNYSVDYVLSGEDAISAVKKREIDIILMDIDLGRGIDGTLAAQEILKLVDLPIVFLSSHTEPEIVEKTEKITSYGYVAKESSCAILDASIKMAFKLFRAKKMQCEIEGRYRTLFETLSDAFVIHEIICDPSGEPVDYRFLDANDIFLGRVGMKREEVIGHTALELFPKTEKEWIRAFGRVALTGKSEVITQYSSEFDKYYEARIYSPERGIFAALFIDVDRVAENYMKRIGKEGDARPKREPE